MTTSDHLAWLLHLMSDNPRGWWHHCKARAEEIARDPEHADLPRLLREAMSTHSKATSTNGNAET